MNALRTVAWAASVALLLSGCPSPGAGAHRDGMNDSPPSASASAAPHVMPAAPASGAPAAKNTGAGINEAKVRLVAQHPLGVPLHPAEHDNRVSGRLPDGTEVTVLRKSADGRWLEVLAKHGERGWVTSRYAPGATPQKPRAPLELDAASEFHSRASCERELAKRRAARSAGVARIMSYNVRRFPDGGRGADTDVDWLACVVASSNADVVAVQEFKNQAQAPEQLERLTARLSALTKGRWVASFDPCPGVMHVGLLYDASRVVAASLDTFAALNPHETPCKDQLRPGFGGYFRFPGGFDLHVISVHLKSAATDRALGLRRRSLSRLGEVAMQAQKAHPDGDLVLAGDFNSMGCEKCTPNLNSAGEIAELDRVLATSRPAFRRVPARPGCSHYFRGEGSLLDHFVVTASMRELAKETSARVGGYCGELGCRPFEASHDLSAYQKLSDHCPVILDFTDRDLD